MVKSCTICGADPMDEHTLKDYAQDRGGPTATDNAVVQDDESFRLTVSRIPAFVSTLTASGAIEFVNDPVLKYFGRTLDELRNWAASDAVHPDDLPNVMATLHASIETGEPSEVELRLRRADGVYRWFLLRRADRVVAFAYRLSRTEATDA